MLRFSTMSQKETLKDMDHTPPTGESVSNVWDRGTDRSE
jgi:hypothetical protein